MALVLIFLIVQMFLFLRNNFLGVPPLNRGRAVVNSTPLHFVAAIRLPSLTQKRLKTKSLQQGRSVTLHHFFNSMDYSIQTKKISCSNSAVSCCPQVPSDLRVSQHIFLSLNLFIVFQVSVINSILRSQVRSSVVKYASCRNTKATLFRHRFLLRKK